MPQKPEAPHKSGDTKPTNADQEQLRRIAAELSFGKVPLAAGWRGLRNPRAWAVLAGLMAVFLIAVWIEKLL